MSHTQGKLKANGSDRSLATWIETESGKRVATMKQGETDWDDARRLVACWNLLEGIATDEFGGKSLLEYMDGQAFLTSVNAANGALDIQMQGGACAMLAANFAGQFKGSGATNFLVLSLEHQEIGEFTVTMQRKQGETPIQQLAKIKAQRNELIEALKAAIKTAEFENHPSRAWHEQARAAIQKAEGDV